MLRYILSKLGQSLIVLLIVTLTVFIILSYMPGSIAYSIAGEESTIEEIKALEAELGLDKPIIVQYGTWLMRILSGEFGWSYAYNMSVAELLSTRIPVTFILGACSLVISVVLGVLMGIVCAVHRGKLLDNLFSVISDLGIAAPQFWIGIMLMLLVAYKMKLVPTSGYTPPSVDFGMFLKQIFLPVLTLSFSSIAAVCRQTRSAMLETIGSDYVRTARAKGLKENVIIFKHVLRNALIPVLTLMGLRIRLLFGGSVLVEQIFNIPGMGRLIVESVKKQDTDVAQMAVLIISIVVILSTLIVDIAYGVVDPRIRSGREGK